MTNKRKSISAKLRFEVFKRDKFQCQYCGRSAPQVILHVDHIEPVAKDGTNDITNLITSCRECNLGKGARRISDDAAILKEKQQLDALNERREQLEMMMQWRKELSELNEQTFLYVESCFFEKTGYTLTENGKLKLRRCLMAFSLNEVIDAIDTSVSQYGKCDASGRMTRESTEKAFDMIYPICSHKRKGDIELGTDSIYYIAGILSNRFSISKKQCLPRLKKADEFGLDHKELKRIALSAKNYRTWRITMEKLTEEGPFEYTPKNNDAGRGGI